MARRRKAPAPAGPRTLAAVRRQLDKGWPAGLTVLTGEDIYHLDRAQREILDHLVPEGERGLGLTLLGDEKIGAGTVVGAARSQGMFASRRVVLLRDVTALEGERGVLSSYAERPPPDSFLLVRAPKLDERRALHRELVEVGRVLAFGPPGRGDEKAVREAVDALAVERDLDLAPDAVDLLLAAAGADYYQIATELDKIAAWVGGRGRKRVDRATVAEAASAGGLLSGWELAEAVERRDPDGAVAAARRLLDSGEEPLRILGGLSWKARTLLEATTGASRGWGRPTGPPRYSRQELLAFPARLLQADRTLKSRSLDPRTVLESLARDLARGRE